MMRGFQRSEIKTSENDIKSQKNQMFIFKNFVSKNDIHRNSYNPFFLHLSKQTTLKRPEKKHICC